MQLSIFEEHIPDCKCFLFILFYFLLPIPVTWFSPSFVFPMIIFLFSVSTFSLDGSLKFSSYFAGSYSTGRPSEDADSRTIFVNNVIIISSSKL